MFHTIVHLHWRDAEKKSVNYIKVVPRMASHYVTERALKKFIQNGAQDLTGFLKQAPSNMPRMESTSHAV
jgi:hypothetical protein